jgi:Mur ligase family, catalytic domain
LKSVVEGGPKVQSATRRQKKHAGMEMELSEVIAGIEGVRLTGGARQRIAAVACDSRKVAADTLFFAMPGAKTDGNEYVADALSRGAVAIASQNPRPAHISRDVAWIEVAAGTERKALALAAANFYRHPADSLKLAGVTGTNGKTTITFILDSILRPTPRRNRWTCRKFSRKCATRAAPPRCWKSARIRWCWTGCGAATSPSQSSPISRAIT